MSETIRYGVVSDTHGRLPARVLEVLDGVRCVFHCGDLGSDAVRHELETVAPLRAVSGNMDPWPLSNILPEKRVEEVEFGTAAISHGARYSHDNGGIARGLLDEFASCTPRLILFGHSHRPVFWRRRGILLLNPGSATLPVHGEPATVAIVTYDPTNDKLDAEHCIL